MPIAAISLSNCYVRNSTPSVWGCTHVALQVRLVGFPSMTSSKLAGIPDVLLTPSERPAPLSEISMIVHRMGGCLAEITISAGISHGVRGFLESRRADVPFGSLANITPLDRCSVFRPRRSQPGPATTK